ncbi:penicillin amidase [Pedobacter hartonius]|uniref:Penicillin amidase n=1 Tax=Pedobacter hartonius TaxID=425514 RepID=A0A1H4H3E3_9SPHI|nr:penicillin amidase [Pedobacter hartonius]
MMKQKFLALIWIIIPDLLVFALNTKFGKIPPILKFLYRKFHRTRPV